MIEVSNCVICDGQIRRRKRALVAPFLATRIWKRAPFCVDLVECRDCGFLFFNPRLDDDETSRLYADYRSEEYQRMRHASEAWYTPKFNSNFASTSIYERRRAALKRLLCQHLNGRKIERILDYGGHRGELVAGLLEGAQAFVFDISGIAAVDGVISTKVPAACRADLIINSNVLEHIAFPKKLVTDALTAAPENGLLFLEVPCELPLELFRLARRTAQLGVMTLTRPRVGLHVFRPASLYMMHEHINYFNKQTLATLVRRCGGHVLASGTYPSSGKDRRADLAWCLASKLRVGC